MPCRKNEKRIPRNILGFVPRDNKVLKNNKEMKNKDVIFWLKMSHPVHPDCD